MPHQSTAAIVATIGINIGKNMFHLVGFDRAANIVLQLKTSRQQLERRLANVPCCLIGMEACSGAHHIGRQLEALGHDVRKKSALGRGRYYGITGLGDRLGVRDSRSW